MMRNVYSLAVFAGGRLLCTKILPGQSHTPSISLGTRKLDSGLPDDENDIPLGSLVLTQYRRVTDRQTDRQTGRHTDGLTDLP